jgi:hypothetical protein
MHQFENNLIRIKGEITRWEKYLQNKKDKYLRDVETRIGDVLIEG